MKSVFESIEERNLPKIIGNSFDFSLTPDGFEKRRRELLALLEQHEYGAMPQKPEHLTVDTEEVDTGFSAGKAVLSKLKFTVTAENGTYTFPVSSVIPKARGKLPAFVHIAFRDDVPDKYLPAEEIADCGFAVFNICYEDVASDSGDFKNGIARLLSPNRRALSSTGKLAMWAWAAMRVMDYVQALDEIDTENVAVIGHSILGKAALLAGAFDERFKYVIANDSGCSGAAVTRGKHGESIAEITAKFPYWFCPRYQKYAANEDALPCDQHFLLAAIAPRHILIGSAKEDVWADPESEFVSACLASEVYERIYGIKGLVHNGEIPKSATVLSEGNIHYHLRNGLHYFSREDWNAYINYIRKHMKNR